MPSSNKNNGKKYSYYDNGYYPSLLEKANKAIAKIDDSKDPVLEAAKQEELRAEGRQELEDILVASGLREPEQPFINPDLELYTPNGEADIEKREKLLKSIISYAAFDQFQWMFYPTTSRMTSITEKAMAKAGKDYSAMLPLEKKREYQSRKDLKSTDGNTIKTYMYPDGTVSGKWYPEKGCLGFDRIGFKSGFDYTAPYDPNTEITGKAWQAGFNPKGEWEKMGNPAEAGNITESGTSPETIRLVFVNEDEVWLYDEEGILFGENITEYYDIHGNLYGATKVDSGKTVETIKKTLTERGVSKLTGIVSRNMTKETQERYKQQLGFCINKTTKFQNYSEVIATRQSKKTEKNQDMLEYKTASEIKQSKKNKDGILKSIPEGKIEEIFMASLITAARTGIDGETYRQLMTGETEETEIPLNIFDTPEIMEMTLASPEMELTKDEQKEIKEYLSTETISVPEQQSVSNTIVNMLASRKGMYINNAHPSPVEVTHRAIEYHKTVKKKPAVNKTVQKAKKAEVSKEHPITKESADRETIILGTPLRNYLEKVSAPTHKTPDNNKKTGQTIHIRETLNPAEYTKTGEPREYDLYTEEGRKTWMETELVHQIPEAALEQSMEAVEKELKTAGTSPEKREEMSKRITRAFQHYKTIQQSTGMKPDELVQEVIKLTTGVPETPRYRNKTVAIEQPAREVYRKAEEHNPHTRTIHSQDLEQTQQPPFTSEAVITAAEAAGATTPQELDKLILTFAADEKTTNETTGSGQQPDIPKTQMAAVRKLLKQSRIPAASRKNFTNNLRKTIKNYMARTQAVSQVTMKKPARNKAAATRQPTLTKAIADEITKAGGTTKAAQQQVQQKRTTPQIQLAMTEAIEKLGLDPADRTMIREAIQKRNTTKSSETIRIIPPRKELQEIQKNMEAAKQKGTYATGDQLVPLRYAVTVDESGRPIRINEDPRMRQIQARQAETSPAAGKQQFPRTITGQPAIPEDLYNAVPGKALDYAAAARYLATPGTIPVTTQGDNPTAPGQPYYPPRVPERSSDPYTRAQRPARYASPQPTAPRTPGMEAEDARLARINANYEQDRQNLDPRMNTQPQTALARSQSHDIGGAGGSGTKEQQTKSMEEFVQELKRQIEMSE